MKCVEAGREPVVSVKDTRASAGELGTPLLPGLCGQAKPTSGMIGDSIRAEIQAMSTLTTWGAVTKYPSGPNEPRCWRMKAPARLAYRQRKARLRPHGLPPS